MNFTPIPDTSKETDLDEMQLGHQCFAHDGIKMLGMIDQCECGIMDRVENWFDTLGIKYEVEPKVTRCMRHTEGCFFRDHIFFFDR
jgi:hypothetical protein